MSFKSLALNENLVDALEKLNYLNPTKIQQLVLPKALKYKSLAIQSVTGSGKSHCFIIPILNNLDFSNLNLQAIVISPTRELARQTYEFFMAFKPYFENLNVKLLIGGHQLKDEESIKNNQPHIIISTPKRMSQVLIDDSFIKLGHIKTVVLDEVDMMMDLGYFNDIESLLDKLKDIQILAFSATFPSKVIHLLKKYIPIDEFISLDKNITNSNVSHYAIDIKHNDKNKMVINFINKYNPYLLLIFCSEKKDVIALYDYLIKQNIKCGILHGDLSARERKNMLKMLKNNNFHIMVCSDMASRGLDIEDVSDILNYDLPNNEEFYFHRAGRTGRLNNKGNSYCFYNVDSVDKIKHLEKNGVIFNYLAYKNNDFVIIDKIKTTKKKTNDPQLIELNKEIKKARSMASSKKVKPNYKKKVKQAVLEVKRKHRRNEIKKAIRKQLNERYKKGNDYGK